MNIRCAWIAVAIANIAACTDGSGTHSGLTAHGEATGAATTMLPDVALITSLSTGPPAGNVIDSARYAVHNPYQGNASAVQEGHRLFIRMNCAYCHGFDAAGGMGPSLQGRSWRFGGDDADVFKTIYGGRGKGMPAWSAAITEGDIWKIVAYLRTFETTTAAPTPGLNRSGVPGAADAGESTKSLNEWEP